MSNNLVLVLETGQRNSLTFHRLAGKEEMERINRLYPLLKVFLGEGTAEIVLTSLVTKGIKAIAEMSLAELMAEGLSEEKAIMLLAALDLGRQWHEEQGEEMTDSDVICDTPKVLNKILAYTGKYDREVFSVVLLDVKNKVTGIYQASIGLLDAALVGPREVFKEAVKNMAAKIIISHNHPSGDTTPSKADIEMTKKICQAGELLGIPVVDHIIIGKNRYTSFVEEGLI